MKSLIWWFLEAVAVRTSMKIEITPQDNHHVIARNQIQ